MSRIMAPTRTRGAAPSHAPPDMQYAPGIGLARCLGWFSIGLGLTQVFCHRPLSRMIGVEDHPTLLPLLGMREIASGVGILAEGRPTEWLWARVVGDMMDLGLLGAALANSNGKRGRVATATAMVAGVAALDTICCTQLTAAAVLEG